MSTRVAVVGGGVSGLAAAHRLRARLGPDAEIVLFEQTGRLGGKLCTVPLAAGALDLGAEAFLARRPEVVRLAEELGLSDQVEYPGGATARVRAGGALHPLPGGTVMGVPSDPEALRGVLSEDGMAALRAESELPPLSWSGDDSVGRLLRERVGDEVVDRLVEPLLGGVYSGSADGLGLRATIPTLAAALDAGARSITSAVAATLAPPVPDGPKPPVFGAFRGGYRQLVDRLAEAASPRLRLGLPVRALHRSGDRWRLEIGSAAAPEHADFDGVVLAVPAPAARRLLAAEVPAAAELLGGIELASMAVLGIALPAGTELPNASGTLIARGEAHADGTPFTAKAFTFSSRKWPHLAGPGGEVYLRASVGRSGDDELLRLTDAEMLRRVLADLREITGVTAEPVDSAVVRWGGGLPQYGVGHLDAVAELERAVSGAGGLALAGAALHGVGVPACVSTGEAAATTVTRHLVAA